MKSFSILVLWLVASFVTSAPSPSSGQSSYAAISRLIDEGDDPDGIAALLGNDHLEYSSYVSEHLRHAIRLNRVESFKYLFSRSNIIDYRSSTYHLHLTNLLGLAVSEHRTEICEFLMAINFQPDSQSNNFWNHLPFQWTVDELVSLVEQHPRFAGFMAPRWHTMARCPNAEAAMTMISFIEHIRYFDDPHCHPTALVEGLVENRMLKDAEMADILYRLLHLGAEVDQDAIDLLAQVHPDHEMTRQVLLHAQDLEIKEPGED